MRKINEIFNCISFDVQKLLAFGFVKEKTGYKYSCFLMNGQFEMRVFVSDLGEIEAAVFDVETEDEYVLVKVEAACGTFVGQVRLEYEAVLKRIAKQCGRVQVFKSDCARQIIQYVEQTYNDKLEFLWPKFPQNAIFRRADNHKWYAVILTVQKNKIGRQGNETIEVVDLRAPTAEIEKLVDGQSYFGGYHMNKKHWMTICLDNSVPVDEICRRIDESYRLAKIK